MTSLIKWLRITPLVFGMALLGAGCAEETPLEQAGEAVDQTVATPDTTADEAADSIKEAAQDTGNALDTDGPVEDAVEDATNANP